jgi:signal transduction histidine kinase
MLATSPATEQSASRPWRAISGWFYANTFTPSWLGGRWRHPLLGYLVAILLETGGLWLGVPLAVLAPGFGLRGLLGMLVVSLLALTYGAGPSLLATLWGALLLGFVLPATVAGPAPLLSGTLLGLGLFTLVGLVVSVSASRTARAYRAAQEAAQRAEQSLRERDAFLSDAAHELKTPITSLYGFSQALLMLADKGTLDPERSRLALRHIEVQADKLNHLVRRLLDVARIDTERLVVERAPTDLTRLCEEVVTAARARTSIHTLTVNTPGPVWAQVDPLRIEQVLTNLVDNAIKYSPDGGPITVAVSRPDAATVGVSVRDQGLGVPEENRARIFERLGQAHAENHLSGLGLGLYISRHIVELHGGCLDAGFPESGGSVFSFRLPCAIEADGLQSKEESRNGSGA